jgi:hypothetical protein
VKLNLKQITKAKFLLKRYNDLKVNDPAFTFTEFFDAYYFGDLVTLLIYCHVNNIAEEKLIERLCVYFFNKQIILNPGMSSFSNSEILLILECNLKYLDKAHYKTYIAIAYPLYVKLYETVKYEEAIEDFLDPHE